MITATTRRRIRDLEAKLADALMPDYPPFTREEIAGIERRIYAGGRLTMTESRRIERETPIIAGELMLSCYQGNVCAKRYLGIDLEKEI